MFDSQWWADEVSLIVSAIPRAQGEDQDGKVARIGRFAGISRATLFSILAGKQTKLFSVTGWIRMLQMIPEGKAEIRREHAEKLLQAVGLNLEKTCGNESDAR